MKNNRPQLRVIPFRQEGAAFVRILNGAPETVTMKSGCVTLAPGASVGEHSTHEREEIVIVLEGRGQVHHCASAVHSVNAGDAIYIPPGTLHNISNAGLEPLRYVYVVAGANGGN